LYSRYKVTTNILYGNVEILQEVPIGSLVVSLSGEYHQRKHALEYLKAQGVYTNILKENHAEPLNNVIKGGF